VIYPKNFEQKIGFDSVRKSLRANCISTLGMALVERISFSKDYSMINKLLEQTEEFRQIIISGNSFPSDHYYDISAELNSLSIEGTYIETETLFDLKRSLHTISECITFFKKDKEELYPRLKEIAFSVDLDHAIIKQIDRIIDDKGKVRDEASPELSTIRSELISKQHHVNKRIAQVMNTVRKQGWAPEDIDMTIRNGRLVIPVLAAYKRNVKGFVHDESATGQTVFIEPADVFEMNNDIRELENAEKREIIKILLAFADFIRPSREELRDCFHFLGLMDFIRAKARYAIQTEAFKPKLLDKPLINWSQARHPLLYVSHKAQKKEIIPLDISLNENARILVISGPNAGGKSVCLKTVGLLQYMLQCGLPVLVKESSEAGIFSNLFIDIGDEQSLENDLSTYSSHLLNMRQFLEHANGKTLFLIDEFGTGTEPSLGGAIAETVLEKLNEKKAYGVVTTHYANLKLLADREEGIANGAMLFDTAKMKPLYQLSIGKAGSSFAFEIAETIGLQKDVIQKAKEKAGVKQISFDRQLQNLDVQKKELDEKETQLRVADDFLAEMIDKYQKLGADLERSKKDIIAKARQEAAELLEQTNKIIEHTIRDIKESQAEKEKTKEVRKVIDDFKEKITEGYTPITTEPESKKEKKREKPAVVKVLNTPIEKGDYVRLAGQQLIGEVVGIDTKEALIVFGSTQLKTKLNKLEKVAYGDFKQQSDKTKSSGKMPSLDLNEKLKHFKTSIDLRGMRADEGISAIQHYIDDALLLSVPEIRILHGKGDGILRHITHDYLRKIKEVKHFEDEVLERGGHGITVVYFR
jgi:DNA mismatch repair protein MutS2